MIPRAKSHAFLPLLAVLIAAAILALFAQDTSAAEFPPSGRRLAR
jgi:hypothetical protein